MRQFSHSRANPCAITPAKEIWNQASKVVETSTPNKRVNGATNTAPSGSSTNTDPPKGCANICVTKGICPCAIESATKSRIHIWSHKSVRSAPGTR